MKKAILIINIGLILSIQVMAQEGTWKIIKGQNLDNASYTGKVNIEKTGNTYDLLWETSVGNSKGIGLLYDNDLYVGFGSDQFGYGVVVYDIKSDGTLDGKWAGNNMGGTIGSEKITSSTAKDLDGTYTIQGTYPNSKSYTGSISIKKTGTTYQCEWSVGTVTYKGVGLVENNRFVVGYGVTGNTYGIVKYTLSKNKANGIWTFANAANTGVENIEKQ